MKKINLIILLMTSASAYSQLGWWTSSDSNHVFNKNRGSVMIGAYQPLGKLTVGPDDKFYNLSLVGDYSNLAKNYLQIGVTSRSFDKLQGQTIFDLYHSNSNPKYAGYNFRVNGNSQFFLNAEGNVGIGTEKPEARLDLSGGPQWGGFTKAIRLPANHTINFDAGENQYGLVAQGSELSFVLGNKTNPFSGAFTKLMTFQPKKIIIDGDVEVRGQITSGGSVYGGGSGGSIFSNSNNTGNALSGKYSMIQNSAIPGDPAPVLWSTTAGGIYNSVAGNVGISNFEPSYPLDVNGDVNTNGWYRVSGAGGYYFQSYGGGFYMADNTWIRTYGNKSFYHNTGVMRTDGVFQVGPNGSRFSVAEAGNGWLSAFTNGISAVYLAHGGGYGMHINTGGTNSAGRYALEVRNASQTHLFVRDDGNVGIGTSGPGYKLTVDNGAIGGTYAMTPKYTPWNTYSTGDGGASIYNDNGSYKALMLVGNNSANGSTRVVKVWDVLDVQGTLLVNGSPVSGGGGSQWTTTNGVHINYSAGNVGIGAAANPPLYALDVAGDARIDSRFRFKSANADGGSFAVIAVDAGATKNFEFYDYFNNRPMLRIYGGNQSLCVGGWNGFTDPGANSLGVGGNAWVTGSVGIGTTNTGVYKLSVNGKIKAQEIYLTTTVWPDHVFENGYSLRSLKQVENFISKNGHLPDIPSESEVIEKGVGVVDMQAKLLQKIEELTLYMIEQNKKSNIQSAEIEKLKKQIQSLEKK